MRCFVQPSEWNRPEPVLDSEEAHHLARVLRASAGDRVDVFDGAGGVGQAEVIRVGRGTATLRMLRREEAPPEPVRLALAQALLREAKMDLVIQKAVELGASAIYPVMTEHCVVKAKEDQAEGKRERWNRIARQAAKQCGAPRLPEIHPPMPLEAWLAALTPSRPALVGALTGATRPFAEALREKLAATPREIAVLIGPEGDFSPSEMEAILKAGVGPVSFGRLVLRAETAALFALSVLRYETNLSS